jgi:hypothetical protein
VLFKYTPNKAIADFDALSATNNGDALIAPPGKSFGDFADVLGLGSFKPLWLWSAPAIFGLRLGFMIPGGFGYS